MSAQPGNPHYRLDQLADGVSAAIAIDGGAAVGNAGIIDLGDATLVVDAFLTPTAAEALRADAERLTGRSPRWVLNTHYHNDHIWGSQVFLPEADLISTAVTRDLIATAGKQEYDDYRAVAEAQLKLAREQEAAAATDFQRDNARAMIGYFGGMLRDFPRLHLCLPDLVFEERLALHGTKRRVELVAFTGAHTRSDAVAYLPDDGIVFMSDLLFSGYHAYLADGDPDRALDVLGSVLAGTAGMPNAQRFVPGHGSTGTSAELRQFDGHIRTCQRLADELAAAGKISPADVASTPIPEPFTHWGLPRFFYANLNFMLKKLRPEAEPARTGQRVSNSFRP